MNHVLVPKSFLDDIRTTNKELTKMVREQNLILGNIKRNAPRLVLDHDDKWMSTRDVADYTGWSMRTIYRKSTKEGLGKKIDGSLKFLKSEIDAYIARKENKKGN